MTLLRFNEGYFDRIWGGSKLRSLLEKPIPSNKIGEAWLISDHPVFESALIDGPRKGTTLRQLLEENPGLILGSRPQLTVHGRFPLLLKILDADDYLSVQVHPDDECAAALGEPDVGKTEMWHILQADPGGEIICGIEPELKPQTFADAVKKQELEQYLVRVPVKAGDSAFIAAGTVHAIGPGLLLAEIQQNSDLTYRIYDWNRLDSEGKPRTLHVEKAMKAIHFGTFQAQPRPEVHIDEGDVRRSFLAACRYFAAEEISVSGIYRRRMAGETFHILLAKSGLVNFNNGENAVRLFPGQALLVPGSLSYYEASGQGKYLDYYVPDIRKDILLPLLNRGYSPETLRAAGLMPA